MPNTFPSQILKQARVALERAAHIIFLVDGRAEITASDRDLSRMLLRLGLPISLAVNKADTGARADLAHDFYSLGIPRYLPRLGRAWHRRGCAAGACHCRFRPDIPRRRPKKPSR